MTINALLERRARETPEKTAARWVTDLGAGSLSWAELARRTGLEAARLRPTAPGRQNIAALVMANGPELLCAELGAFAAGCTAAPIDPCHPAFVVRQSLAETRFRFLLAGDEGLLRWSRAAGLSNVEQVVTAGAQEPLPARASLQPGEEMRPEAALLALTAGSSGRPKRVLLSQPALLAAGRGLASALRLREEQAYLTLSHLSSPWALQEFLACLQSGSVFCFTDAAPSPALFSRAVREFSPDFIRAGCEVLLELLGTGPSRRPAPPAGDFPPRPEKPVRLLVSTGTLPPEAAARLAERGYAVSSCYGLTEACGIVTLGPPGAPHQGVSIAGVEVRAAHNGELLVGGETLMSGYLEEEPGAGARLAGGLLHTGDSGSLDAAGNLLFSGAGVGGAVKEGRGVPAGLIEDLLTRNPLFQRAVVLGGGPDGPSSSLALVFPDLNGLRRRFRARAGLPAGNGELLKDLQVQAFLHKTVKDCLRGLPKEDAPGSVKMLSRHPRVNALELCPDRRLRRSIFKTRFQAGLQACHIKRQQARSVGAGRVYAGPVPAAGATDFIFLTIELDALRPSMLPDEDLQRTSAKLEKILTAGIPSLLAAAEHAGFRHDHVLYRFRTSQESQPQLEELAAALAARPAGIIAVSCFSLTLPFALKTLEALKRAVPRKKVVMGGCGPSGAAQAILRHCPYVDAVVKGEGEIAFPRVLAALRDGKPLAGIPGVTCRAADGGLVTTPPERISDLDALPKAAYQYMDGKNYVGVGISTMRGCPNSCKYCGNRHMFGSQVAFRSLDCVLGDIETLYREKQKNFFFMIDEIFTLDKRRAIEFCSRFEKRFSGKAAWFCYSTVDALDEELMEAMAASGCTGVYIGVESGSARVLKHNKRTQAEYSVEEAMKKVAAASRFFSNVTIFLVVGFREESLHDFLETLRLSRAMTRRGYGYVRIFWLKPIPLTPVFEDSRDTMTLATSRFHWPPPHHINWVKDLALLDPSLAPWVMVVPTPFLKLKEFLYYYFISQGSRGEKSCLARLKKRLLGLAIDWFLDATRFLSRVPQ